jgi:hypothetical protein
MTHEKISAPRRSREHDFAVGAGEEKNAVEFAVHCDLDGVAHRNARADHLVRPPEATAQRIKDEPVSP